VKNDGQSENCAPFLQSSGKSLPVTIKLARLQTNGWRRVVAGVTQSLSNGRYVTYIGTHVLNKRRSNNTLPGIYRRKLDRQILHKAIYVDGSYDIYNNDFSVGQ